MNILEAVAKAKAGYLINRPSEGKVGNSIPVVRWLDGWFFSGWMHHGVVHQWRVTNFSQADILAEDWEVIQCQLIENS